MDGAVLVTGAAGALGHAVVAELRSRDLAVIALDRPSAALEKLGAADGVRHVPVELADRGAVHAAFAKVDAKWPRRPRSSRWPAGSSPASSPISTRLTRQPVGVQRGLAAWCSQEAAPRMAAAGGGAILTVGSKTAVGGPAPLAHALSKSAVVRATELLADELRPQGIRVNCVLPSVIDSPPTGPGCRRTSRPGRSPPPPSPR